MTLDVEEQCKILESPLAFTLHLTKISQKVRYLEAVVVLVDFVNGSIAVPAAESLNIFISEISWPNRQPCSVMIQISLTESTFPTLSKLLRPSFDLSTPRPWEFTLVQAIIHMGKQTLSFMCFEVEFEEVGDVEEPRKIDIAFVLAFKDWLISEAFIHLLLRFDDLRSSCDADIWVESQV